MIWDGGLVALPTVSTCAWFRETKMRRGLCTMCDQSQRDLCLGGSVARDRHVVIGWTLAGSAGPVQSCLCSLSHINVTRAFSAAPCESLQWAIQVNCCSAEQSRDPDAAMPIGICESWLFPVPLTPAAAMFSQESYTGEGGHYQQFVRLPPEYIPQPSFPADRTSAAWVSPGERLSLIKSLHATIFNSLRLSETNVSVKPSYHWLR